jgi:hypothetical protein
MQGVWLTDEFSQASARLARSHVAGRRRRQHRPDAVQPGGDIGDRRASTFAVRLQTTLQDLAGFAPTYAAVVAVGLLVAFLVTGRLVRRWPQRRTSLYTLAGAAAIITAILLMNAALPITGIGATRSLAGLIALGAAGALGGRLFAALAPFRARPRMA